jgi:hypothetical protein
MFVRCRNSAVACLGFALAGCSNRDIATYRVPKDPDAAAAPADAGAPAAQTVSLRWTAPAGWQPQAASGLRAASFLAPGPGGATADVSVVTFAGAGGDVLANINRWRGQLQLPPITAGDLPANVNALDEPAGHFLVADIRGVPATGQPAIRILGAWLEQPDQVWFFKMMGSEEVVEAQKGSFLGFLRSVAAGASSAGAPHAAENSPKASDNTNDLPHAGFVVAPTDAAGEPSLHWQAPSEWKAKPVSTMRKGSYTISQGGVEADLAITAFPGEVGGLAANVNRWRGQVGLQPVDDSALGTVTASFDANGLHFTLVDFAGPAPSGPQRILAALVSWQGATWFFKLTGPDSLVENERPSFLAFLKTVQPK